MFNPRIGEIFHTNNSGDCKILELISGDIYNNAKVKIVFLETGFEKIAMLKNVIQGNVRDNTLPAQNQIPIDYDKIYECNSGPYKIIGEAGINPDDGARMLKVLFLNTGNTQSCRAYRAMRGQIKDQKLYEETHNVTIGKIYPSNSYGDFEVIEELEERSKSGGHKMSKIKFVQTGTIATYSNCAILMGNVVDPYYPSVCGIGCLGNASSKCKEYSIWHDMIRRCYDTKDIYYQFYGGIGVTVDKRWLCFEYFLEDFKQLPGYDQWLSNTVPYTLDKDYLQQNIPKGCRVYSKDTCMLIPKSENSRLSAYEKNINNNTNSRFLGVSYERNLYRASITINGTKLHLGNFTNEIAAANAYIYALNAFHPNQTIPIPYQFPIMTPSEFNQYNNSVKIVAKVVK